MGSSSWKLSIDVSAVADFEDEDDKFAIVYFVDYAVVTDSDAAFSLTSFELDTVGGGWIFSKFLDGF